MTRAIEILLVEDNPADADLAIESLERCKVSNTVHVVEDGEEALAFMRREPPFENAPRPDLVLLDLNLPKMGGMEVLEEVKSDSVLRRIPIVVLTSSEAEIDILRSYDLHANSFIAKPIDLEGLTRVVAAIETFWFTVVKLPHTKRGAA